MPRECPCHDAFYYRTARLLSLEESPAIRGNGCCRFIGGILLLIDGLSVTPFSQARRDQPTRFSRCFPFEVGNSQRESVRSRTDHKDVDTRRPWINNVPSCTGLESRFYAVLSKAASKWPSVKATPIEVPGPKRPKGRESSNKQK
jgi:hypothetical protein